LRPWLCAIQNLAKQLDALRISRGFEQQIDHHIPRSVKEPAIRWRCRAHSVGQRLEEAVEDKPRGALDPPRCDNPVEQRIQAGPKLLQVHRQELWEANRRRLRSEVVHHLAHV
jgi:hypothetical protein